MPRWLFFAPLAALVMAVAALGLRQGYVRATLTETDVINRYAAQYLQEAGPGAALTDCLARPGQRAGVWLVVICTAPAQAGSYAYYVNRLGALEFRAGPEAQEAPGAAPELGERNRT